MLGVWEEVPDVLCSRDFSHWMLTIPHIGVKAKAEGFLFFIIVRTHLWECSRKRYHDKICLSPFSSCLEQK